MTPDSTSQSMAYAARFQRSIAGVCVALLVVLGLVSVPATCECGAGIAHGHSIFTLPGHHHASDGTHMNMDHAGPSVNEHHSIEKATNSGPQLAGKVAHGSDRLSVALAAALTLSDAWQRISYPGTVDDPGNGWSDAPDAPPPQELLPG